MTLLSLLAGRHRVPRGRLIRPRVEEGDQAESYRLADAKALNNTLTK